MNIAISHSGVGTGRKRYPAYGRQRNARCFGVFGGQTINWGLIRGSDSAARNNRGPRHHTRPLHRLQIQVLFFCLLVCFGAVQNVYHSVKWKLLTLTERQMVHGSFSDPSPLRRVTYFCMAPWRFEDFAVYTLIFYKKLGNGVSPAVS